MLEFNKYKYRFSKSAVKIDVNDKVVMERENQISILIKELYLFRVFLRDLVGHAPKEKDRNLILNISYYLIENDKYLDRILERREIPFGKLSKDTGIPKSFLENWQDYILCYMLILSNDNYEYIRSYLGIEIDGIREVVLEKNVNTVEGVHKGIVIKVSKKTLIIMTSLGEFIKIKKQDEINIGEETRGKIKVGLNHYKLHFAIGLMIILIISFGMYYYYNHPVTTVIFSGTSQVKLEVNNSNKVVYSYSSTEKGKDLINSQDPLYKNIDIVLRDFVEYAKENNMIPKDGILVTVTGKKINYGVLKETAQYVYDNNVSMVINNDGHKHNIYELADKNKE